MLFSSGKSCCLGAHPSAPSMRFACSFCAKTSRAWALRPILALPMTPRHIPCVKRPWPTRWSSCMSGKTSAPFRRCTGARAQMRAPRPPCFRCTIFCARCPMQARCAGSFLPCTKAARRCARRRGASSFCSTPPLCARQHWPLRPRRAALCRPSKPLPIMPRLWKRTPPFLTPFCRTCAPPGGTLRPCACRAMRRPRFGLCAAMRAAAWTP